MVPQALSVGMVAPNILRPSNTAPAPSQTIAPAQIINQCPKFSSECLDLMSAYVICNKGIAPNKNKRCHNNSLNALTNGSRSHVRNKTREEFLSGQILIMSLHVFLSGSGELHGDELVSLLFESLDDFSDESPLDAVGLDHDV